MDDTVKTIFPRHLSVLFASVLLLQACGDSEEQSGAEAKRAPIQGIWLSSGCADGSQSLSERNTYEFTALGQILAGEHRFSDSNCNNLLESIPPRAPSYHLPNPDYQVSGSTVDINGIQAYEITIERFFSIDLVSGFYFIDNESLCFSENLKFHADTMYVQQDADPMSFDLNHCLTRLLPES